MSSPVSIVLVGISGMGSVYLEALLRDRRSDAFSLEGAVDPFPERCSRLDELRALNIPVFGSPEEFYDRSRAELAIISSPIHFHCEQTLVALARGSDLLCEKPPAATIQEVRARIEARDLAGQWVAVGYQWSFSAAVQSLKKDIRHGLLGNPRRLKCLYLWPRDEVYYRRNDWAGRQKDGQGSWILDSPANNAMAHDLHNMFYILGRTRETSAVPLRVEAELYRAYGIENFDTAAIRCLTAEGTEILFYASHSAAVDTGPVFSYEFEGGTVSAAGRGTDITASIGGRVKNYGCPDVEPLRKMSSAIACVQSRRLPACGLEAAMSQTLCINGAQDSMPDVREFPPDLLEVQGEPGRRSIRVRGLDEALRACYERNCLPSELGISWGQAGRPVELRGYGHFPGGRTRDG